MGQATFETAMRDIFAKYKKRAARVGLDFELTWEEFITLARMDCFYCSRPPRNRLPRKEDFFYNGIDRKDNLLPYTLENSVPCCAICNRGKNALGYEEWLEYLDHLVRYRSENESTGLGPGSIPNGEDRKLRHRGHPRVAHPAAD